MSVQVVLENKKNGERSIASLPRVTGAVCERLGAFGYTIVSSTPIKG